MAQWAKCTQDSKSTNRRVLIPSEISGPLQTGDGGDDGDAATTYNPDRALILALRDWLPHVLSRKSLDHELSQRNILKLRSDESASAQLVKEDMQLQDKQKEAEQQQQDDVKMVDASSVPENTSSPTTTSKTSESIDASSLQAETADMIDANSCDSCDMQDNAISSEQQATRYQPSALLESDCVVCSTTTTTTTTTADTTSADRVELREQEIRLKPYSEIDMNSLAFFVDFFYLPFEHGLRAYAFLEDIKWLIHHSDILIAHESGNNNSTQSDVSPLKTENEADEEAKMNEDGGAPKGETNIELSDGTQKSIFQVAELWTYRAGKFVNICMSINGVVETMIRNCPNKPITAELYPYFMELQELVRVLIEYVKFLRHRSSTSERFYLSNADVHQSKESFTTDDGEPWVHRGGLIGDIERLIL